MQYINGRCGLRLCYFRPDANWYVVDSAPFPKDAESAELLKRGWTLLGKAYIALIADSDIATKTAAADVALTSTSAPIGDFVVRGQRLQYVQAQEKKKRKEWDPSQMRFGK